MAVSSDKIAELRKKRNITSTTSTSNKKVSSVDISKMRREREERQAKSQASREVMREMVAPPNMSFPEQNIRRNVQTNQMKQFNESPVRFNRLMDKPDFKDISKKGSEIENKPGKEYLFGLIKGKPEINNPVEYVNQNLPELVMGTSIRGKSDYDLRLSKLTPDERNIYNYLLSKESRESADAYIKELDSELNRRYTTDFSKAISEVSDDNKAIGALTNVGSSLFTPAAYLETVRQKASDLLTGKETQIDPYSSAFSPVHMEGATREGLKEDTGAFGDFLIDTGLSMAQFLSKIPLGQNLALGIMASGAAGSSATDVLQRGGTTDQALMIGAVAGLAEGITEKIGMERLFRFKDMPLNGIKTILRETVKGMGSEGAEELITEVVNILADKIIMQDKSDYDALKRQFIQSGLSEGEATGKAILELAKQVGISFAGGALSGGIMGAGAFGLNVASGSHQGSNINNVNDYVSQGLNMDHTSEAYQLAQQIKTDIVNEVKPSNYQIGNLARLVSNANIQNITKSAVDTMDEQFETTTPVEAQSEITQENVLMNIAREMNEPTPQIKTEPNTPDNSQKAQATIKTTQTENNLPTIETKLETENTKPIEKATNVEATWRDIENTKVKGIERVDNGNVTVAIETDGKTVIDNIDNVTFDNPSVEQVYNSAKVYQTNGAKAFVSNYNGNIDIPVYQRAFNNYYDAGLVSLPMDKINSAYGAFLSESVRMNAYNAGMNDAKTETESIAQKQTTEKKEKKVQKKKTPKKVSGIIPTEASKKLDTNTRDGLNALAKATGIKIRVEESIAGGQANGMYKNGTLHIALDSDNPYMVVAKHELTHAIQQSSPKLYKEYKDFVIKAINKSDANTFNQMVDSLINAHDKVGMEITRSQAMDEIVADASEMFLTDAQAINELAKENKNLAQKIIDFLSDLVKKIQATLTDMDPKSKAAIELNKDLEVSKQAEKLWIEALADTSATKTNNVDKFSLKDGKASFTNERLESILEKYGSKSTRSYSQAYVTYISPDKFLSLTTTNLSRIEKQSTALDTDRLRSETQDIFLHFDQETGEVTGHEGRHRMVALRNEGINQVPVVLIPDGEKGRYERSKIRHKTLTGQEFYLNGEQVTANGYVPLKDIIPASYEYKTELENTFTNNADVQFSLKDTDGYNIADEYEGYSNGQNNYNLIAKKNNGLAGYISYSEYNDIPYVNMIEVMPEYRRQGVGTNLVQALQKKYKGIEISFGYTTPDGTSLLSEVLYDEANPKYNEKLAKRVENLNTEIKRAMGKSLVNEERMRELYYKYKDGTISDNENMEYNKVCKIDIDFRDKISSLNNKLYNLTKDIDNDVLRKNKQFVRYSLKDSDGNNLTKEQQDFFKDSNVRDGNGNLLVVYHGTNAEFNVFDNTFNKEGNGAFWLSMNKDYSEELASIRKGDRIIEAYVNITNPLYVTMNTQQFSDFVEERQYIEQARKEGNDGIIFTNDTNNEILKDTFYAVFESNQIKSIDNLNPTNDADIRYQLKNVDYEEYSRVLAENKQLNETVDLIRKQFDLTKDIVPNKDKLTKIARNILKKTNSTYDLDTLVYNLEALWKYTKSSEYPDINQLMDASYSMAKMILKTSKYLDDGMYKQYSNLRDKLRNTGMTISEIDRGDLADVGGYHQFHKDNFGRIKLVNEGTSVDTIYSELMEEYPEFFTDDITHPADRLKRIAEVAADLQPTYINDYGMDIDEYSMDIANEMYDAYFNVPEATLPEQIKSELKLANQEYKANIQKAREESKAEFETRLTEIRAEKDRLIKSLEEKYEQANAEDRIKFKEQINRVNQDKYDRLFAQQTKYRDMAKKKSKRLKSNAEARNHRANIEKNVKTLSEWLIKPKDNKHVPEFLRKTVADFIQTIDFTKIKSDGEETQKSLKWKETMNRLKQQMKEIDNPANWDKETNLLKDTYLDIDPNFLDRLESFIDNTQVRVLSELDQDQLAELDYLVKVVRKSVTSANQMLANDRYKYVNEVGEATIRETKALKEKKQKDGMVGKADKFFSLDQMDSFTFGDEIGSAGASIIGSLRSGFDKFVLNTKEAIDYIDSVKAKYKDIDIKKIRNEVHTFSIKGGEVKMTTSQIMELYMLAKREQSLGHITGGGIKIENKTIHKGLKKEVLYSYKSTVLSESDLASILATLTQEQQAMAEDLRSFFDVAARWGNEVTMKLYDDMKFTEENYYPIKTDENTNKTNDPEASRGLYALKNLGVTKGTVKGANNPIIISDIFDTFSNHVSEMANYNAFVVPLSDVMKWYNFKLKNVDQVDGTIQFDTVKQGIERVLGKDGKQYFTNLIKDINGVHKKSYSTEIIDVLLRNVKVAAVGMNPSVVLQQPAAYLRAASIMDYKYILEGLAKKPQIQKAKQYSPIALWKSWGFFDINIGRSLQTLITDEVSLAENIREKSLWAAGMMDELTWGVLWNAVEAEISNTNPSLTYGSEEFNQAVGKRLSYIVDRTQVVDTVFHRSQMMRSKDTGVGTSAAFMSEPNKSYNLARTAILDALKNKNTKSIHNACKVVMGVVLSNALAAALKSLYTALGDDDDELEKLGKDDYINRYIKDFGGEFIGNINPLNLIPLVKDIQSMADGYAPQQMHLSGLYTLVLNLKSWKKYITGDSKKTIPQLLKQSVDGLSKTFGIPASGLLKSITKAYHGSIDALENIGLLEKVSEYEKLKVKYDINDLNNSTASSKYYELLYNAKENGDTTLYNQIYKDLIKSGRKPSSIESAIKSRQKKKLYNPSEEYTNPLIKDLVSAQDSKNYNTYKATRDKLVKEGFTMSEIESAVNSYKRDSAKANAPTVDEWVEAYKTGNRNVWQPIFRKMRDAGWTQKDLLDLVK